MGAGSGLPGCSVAADPGGCAGPLAGKEPPAEKESALRIGTILRAVALAMGVAAAVLPMLDALEVEDGISLLGLGLACLAASTLGKSS